ncbi:23S rRNA (cytidine1920-2'-O)/16S rRNA (cytidine1409-2'-O)-methyltransferase [Methylorubrum rhodinum]|uniref:23S rRNA (Cytidine1920-2'-O)/16S rRNA (Cytidine1409-2'-O)-methyltransferase n=1 Tax=Methylorubrum rhodinum TaxID=29428 RepID=A0A840ZIM7_9HYPH|nr:TlyA family RNA methyltransferase [Methylorubrum rhodinum]MBB5757436.1 23S rRNA (cytidine1920-2'-O)/16S rRNA (cytidine1409-2'-O)-methyltransferase [Methylorubrum rhodinum]
MTGERLRADRVLVERGHFRSRAQARAAIEAGLVFADGCPVTRPAAPIAEGARIEAAAAHPYVSRGGLKLAAALDALGIDPAGLPCLDVGASTGGFTDVLLRRGAAHVHAVDVGRDQFDASLRADPRVSVREGTDIRSLEGLDPAPRLAVVDVSFIGLRLVLPSVSRLLAGEAALVALIKPQFEAGRERVGRGGIVRDEAVHAEVCEAVRRLLTDLGFTLLGLIPSPVEGGDGNREFLIGAKRTNHV